MAYIGFDLDETLGSFGPLHSHIFFFTPEEVYTNLLPGKQPFALSDSLRKKLKGGLNAFAACLVAKDSELGILRKGILKIMRRLSEAKANGKIRAINIYSNNGNLGLLLLASAMIEHAIGAPGLFCNHVDWFNPLRAHEITPGRPGEADKTPGVLRKSFVHPGCGIDDIEDIPIENMYFFDDRLHHLISTIISPNNYFQVNPYRQEVVDLNPVDECLDSALQTTGLAEDPEYLAYIQPILATIGISTNRYEDILATVKKRNEKYVPNRKKFQDDTEAIIQRIDAIFPPTNYGENYFPVVDGGNRKKQKRQRVKRGKMSKKRKIYHKRTRKN